MRRRTPRGALVTGAAAVLLLAVSPAASADVRVSPGEAHQGDGVDLTFQVREDEPGAWTSAVQIILPADAPVAEVYPLSVPDWTPKIEYRQAHQPLQTAGAHAHGDGGTVTSSITWFRGAKPSAPRAPSELRVAMAPMPRADRLAFTVVQTYSDGAVRRWDAGTGPVIRLSAAAPAPAPAADGVQKQVTAPGATADRGGWPAALVLLMGLSAGLLIAVAALGRRRRTSTDEAPLDPVPDTNEPLTTSDL